MISTSPAITPLKSSPARIGAASAIVTARNARAACPLRRQNYASLSAMNFPNRNKGVTYHGRPCGKCAGTERYLSCHNCIRCSKASAAKRRRAP